MRRSMHVFALVAAMALLTAGCSKPSEVRRQRAEGVAERAVGSSAPDATGSARADTARASRSSSAVVGGGTAGSGDKAPGAVTVPPVTRGPVVGITAKTIKLGFIVVSDNDKLLSNYGVRGGAIGNTRDQVNAVIDDLNARGGIHGRKIQTAIRELSATGDGTAQYSAMCAGFTQDDKVFAVLSPWNPDPAFAPCLAKKGTFFISDALLQYDAETFSELEPYVVSGLFSSSRGAVALATGLYKSGFFKGKQRLGIVRSSNPIFERVSNRHLKPTLASFGIKPVAETTSGTSTANDAVLYMKDRDVDHIVFLSAAGGPPLFFMTAAQSQGYFPTYGLGSPDSPSFQQQNAPYTQLRGARAVGWAPAFDVLDSEGPPLSSAEKRCLDVHAKGGTNYGTRTEAAAIAMAFCDMVWLFEAAGKAAGRELTKESWSSALAALGSRHETVMTFRTQFVRGGFDGAVAYRPMAYDDSANCRCFKYTGPPATISR